MIVNNSLLQWMCVMRYMVFALPLLAFSAGSAFADHPATTIRIDKDGQPHKILTDDKGKNAVKIRLKDEVGGNGSDHASVTIDNQSGGEIKYEIHTHDPLDFIKFHTRDEDDGDVKLPITDTAKAGKKHAHEFYVHLKEGTPAIYQDLVHITVWNAANEKIADTEFDIVASFTPKGGFTKGRPEGYAMWTTPYNGKMMRLDVNDLPIRVYSDDPKQQQLVDHAVEVWNEAGQLAIKKDFFVVHPKADGADCPIAWKDKLEGKVLGLAYVRGDAPYMKVEMLRHGADAVEAEKVKHAETLIQELGHVLGLDHSRERGDLMFKFGDKARSSKLVYVKITERDYAAVNWLYSQPFDEHCVKHKCR